MASSSKVAVKEAEEKLYEREKWFSSTAAISFGLFFLLVGVPIWWQTTTVYRADLPYSQIKQAFLTKPNLRVDIEVVICAPDVSPVVIAQFGERLQISFKGMNTDRDYVSLKYRGSLRLATAEELQLLSSISSPGGLDNEILNGNDEKYTIYVLSSKPKGVHLPYINKQRQLFTSMPTDMGKLPEVIPSLEKMCQEIFRPAALSRSFQVVHGAPLNDKELLRSVKFDSAYTIVFSLLVPEPGMVMAGWDMSTGVKEYLSDFQETFGHHVDLKIKSQILYYQTLAMSPKKDKTGAYYYLSPTEMPHLINPIEARLGSFVDTSPTLNFIVYVPTSKQYPLHLHNEKGEKASVSSFLVPRWGGFYVYNVNTTADNYPIKHQLELGQVFTELLPQIKALLGFSDITPQNMMSRSAVRDSSLTQWELDQWMRKKTIENLGTSTHALYSMSKLVQNIRNMVINDDISQQVSESVSAIMQSYEHMNKGSIIEAFKSSKKAIKSAEKAFFDNSLLELLYFPEDQKFAIYIPLFLPVGLPLLTSTIAAIKWFRGKKTAADVKPKTE